MKIQECYREVSQEDDPRKSIVQQTLKKSTGFLRRIIAPIGRKGGVTLSYVCLHCHRYPLEDYIWWVSTRHGSSSAIGGPRRAAANMTGGTLTESWFYRTARTVAAKVFRAHAPPNGVCENLVCALNLSANQQLGGHSLVQVVVECLQERNRSKIIGWAGEVHQGGQSRGGERR